DHARAAGDRAVEQVAALGPDLVAEAGLAVHVDGAHLDVDRARLQVHQGAGRARDDLLHVVGRGDDRKDDVCFRGDLGRAGGDFTALPEEFGRAAAAVARDVEAAHHQVPGDGQTHLAQADHAHSVHRCLLAAVAWYLKLYAVWRLGSRGCGWKLHAVWRLAGCRDGRAAGMGGLPGWAGCRDGRAAGMGVS